MRLVKQACSAPIPARDLRPLASVLPFPVTCGPSLVAFNGQWKMGNEKCSCFSLMACGLSLVAFFLQLVLCRSIITTVSKDEREALMGFG
jgi:hypothetical protein